MTALQAFLAGFVGTVAMLGTILAIVAFCIGVGACFLVLAGAQSLFYLARRLAQEV